MYFRYFVNISHGKGWVLYLKRFESTSPKQDLCQVWFKLASCFRRRRFLNLVNIFSFFRFYLPIELGVALHLNKFEFLHPRTLCAMLWIWPSGSGEEDNNVKKFTTTTTTTTTDNGKFSIRKAHLVFGSGELHVIKKERQV